METLKTLYTSADIRRTIIDIFSKSKGRRMAITAFVGGGAEAYLPKPKGIELICWPKAGGTNPEAIRKLLKLGVKIKFADSLHMKIYWTEDMGVVITSANLSTNALGTGSLKEIGILVPSNILNINEVVQAIRPKSVTKQDLNQLEVNHRDYYRVNKSERKKLPSPTFLDWFESKWRSEWKIGYWDAVMPVSQAAKRISSEQYNKPSPVDFIACAKDTYRKNDWILSFRIEANKPKSLSWQYVDYVVKTGKSDKAYNSKFPYQAIQVWPMNRYVQPPFNIKEKRFRNALTVAIQKYGIAKFDKEDPSIPPTWLLKLIRANY